MYKHIKAKRKKSVSTYETFDMTVPFHLSNPFHIFDLLFGILAISLAMVVFCHRVVIQYLKYLMPTDDKFIMPVHFLQMIHKPS